jgi:hypothetical protein
MLRNCVTEGKDNIVSWLPDGNAFKVHKVPDFVSKILPMYFKQTKYKSFQRQLNLWGFERLTSGPDKGAYYHDQFLRDDPDLCSKLTRQRARKSGAVTAEGGPTAATYTTKLPKPTTTPPKPKQQKPTKKTGATKRSTSTTLTRQPIIVQPALGPPPPPVAAALGPPLIVPEAGSLIMPRQVSESSLESFGELLREFDGCHPGTLDLAEFEGFTFHLLEQERYEELNLEFKFNPASTSAPSTLAEIDQSAQTLLQELEQGTFGTPETNYYYSSFTTTDGSNTTSVSV